jgi:hypothetical protein
MPVISPAATWARAGATPATHAHAMVRKTATRVPLNPTSKEVARVDRIDAAAQIDLIQLKSIYFDVCPDVRSEARAPLRMFCNA